MGLQCSDLTRNLTSRTPAKSLSKLKDFEAIGENVTLTSTCVFSCPLSLLLSFQISLHCFPSFKLSEALEETDITTYSNFLKLLRRLFGVSIGRGLYGYITCFLIGAFCQYFYVLLFNVVGRQAYTASLTVY